MQRGTDQTSKHCQSLNCQPDEASKQLIELVVYMGFTLVARQASQRLAETSIKLVHCATNQQQSCGRLREHSCYLVENTHYVQVNGSMCYALTTSFELPSEQTHNQLPTMQICLDVPVITARQTKLTTYKPPGLRRAKLKSPTTQHQPTNDQPVAICIQSVDTTNSHKLAALLQNPRRNPEFSPQVPSVLGGGTAQSIGQLCKTSS